MSFTAKEAIKQLSEAKDFILNQCSLRPTFGIVLGSGLASFVEEVQIKASIPYSQIPHFAPSRVEGHPGNLILGHLHNKPVVLLQGRIHFYEGHELFQVVFPIRVLGLLGIKTVIITNAAGGLDTQMQPGDFMIIKDHINLTGHNPLVGPNIEELGTRFPDMSAPYHPQLIEWLKDSFKKLQFSFHEGVYCGVLGPSYETAAEVQYLRKIGGHAVGMSTVPEVIAARHMGLNVAGLSCISNLATGLSSQKITHDEVKEITRKVEHRFKKILLEFTQKSIEEVS